MGYPNFGKVKTITLPYEEDMTASQYLDRYGIDLATIELYDLINIALDDVVYPVLYIDKVNKVLFMADRAYSYNGGLSAVNNSLINAVIASGTIANAKPIYYHGIEFSGDNNCEIQCMILNNDETPFTKTTFEPYIKGLMDDGAIINCNGCVTDNSNVYPTYLIVKAGSDYVIAYHTTSDTQQTVSFDGVWANVTYYKDSVNKIN